METKNLDIVYFVEPCKFEEGKNAIREDDSTSKN